MDDIKVLRLVSMIIRKYKTRLSKSLVKFDLTAGEYPLYMVICREPGLTQDEISAKAYVDKGFTTRVLKSFIENGFIYKEQDENAPSDEIGCGMNRTSFSFCISLS